MSEVSCGRRIIFGMIRKLAKRLDVFEKKIVP